MGRPKLPRDEQEIVFKVVLEQPVNKYDGNGKTILIALEDLVSKNGGKQIPKLKTSAKIFVNGVLSKKPVLLRPLKVGMVFAKPSYREWVAKLLSMTIQ